MPTLRGSLVDLCVTAYCSAFRDAPILRRPEQLYAKPILTTNNSLNTYAALVAEVFDRAFFICMKLASHSF